MYLAVVLAALPKMQVEAVVGIVVVGASGVGFQAAKTIKISINHK
jgi:RsiW-degrading membrane proteinase PrsW (M82 family)